MMRNAQEFDATGSCVAGLCEYPYTDTPCAGGSWCDTDTCVPCDSDLHCGASCLDCTASGLVCNTAGVSCVQCNVDGDCAELLIH